MTAPTGHIQTFTGRMVDPFALRPGDIHFDDIAGPLSRTCRFSGHTSAFYSVAQHAWLVSHIAGPLVLGAMWPTEDDWRGAGANPECVARTKAMVRIAELHGLAHDFAEAYLMDVPSPYKGRVFVEGHAMTVFCDGADVGIGGAMEPFGAAEYRALDVIHAALGIPPAIGGRDAALIRDVVRRADLIALATEARDLMGAPLDPSHEWASRLPMPMPDRIVPLCPAEAEAAFRARWAELGP